MYNIYLYPKSGDTSYESRNPYMTNLEVSLAKCFKIANKGNNKKGVLDFFGYLFKVDAYYFNWIENLRSLRFGKLQIIFFSFFLFWLKLLKKKIIWTLHNKYAHNVVKNAWTDYMYKTMMRHADLIITHSSDGVSFTEENYPQYASKVKYIIHPVEPALPATEFKEFKYDFLIWGIVYPYKGVLEFLKFIHESGYKEVFKIFIAGKCVDTGYKNQLVPYLTDNIVHDDVFYEMEDIVNFAGQSKFILYTYKANSVLSSGSLMDSIRMGSRIIGPAVGAFKDLSSFNFVKTFNRYEDIISTYQKFDPAGASMTKEVSDFCIENSWEKFADWLCVEFSHVEKRDAA